MFGVYVWLNDQCNGLTIVEVRDSTPTLVRFFFFFDAVLFGDNFFFVSGSFCGTFFLHV